LQDLGPAHRFRLDEALKLLGRAFAERNELKADKLLFDLGSAMAAFTASLSFATISFGIPPGAATDCQAAQSKPGTPTSASGGMSGAAAARCAVVTPSARTLPAWISG
jgi:hypothetical protein